MDIFYANSCGSVRGYVLCACICDPIAYRIAEYAEMIRKKGRKAELMGFCSSFQFIFYTYIIMVVKYKYSLPLHCLGIVHFITAAAMVYLLVNGYVCGL